MLKTCCVTQLGAEDDTTKEPEAAVGVRAFSKLPLLLLYCAVLKCTSQIKTSRFQAK